MCQFFPAKRFERGSGVATLKNHSFKVHLVGGFNPFENNQILVKLDHFPKDPGEYTKRFETTT